MAKRKVPETSREAYGQVSVEMLSEHYRKIVKSLTALGTANYEKIADHNGMEPHAVARRLKEMEKMELLYKPGTTSKTKSGRKAFDYCLTGSGLPRTDNEKKELQNFMDDWQEEPAPIIKTPVIKPTQANLFQA